MGMRHKVGMRGGICGRLDWVWATKCVVALGEPKRGGMTEEGKAGRTLIHCKCLSSSIMGGESHLLPPDPVLSTHPIAVHSQKMKQQRDKLKDYQKKVCVVSRYAH